MRRIYCISGLGADERIFQKLKIKDAELVFLKWPEFQKFNDLPAYARKMSEQIPDDNAIVLGLSFGGMIAVELAKIMKLQKIFLVSSAKTKNELPELSKVFQVLIKNNLIPLFLYNTPNKYLIEYFGAKTEEEKELISNIIRDSDPHFMKWAFRAIMYWQNETYPQNLKHVHGTADQIILAQNVNPDHWVKNGTHMMVYSNAEEVSRYINENL